MPTAAVKGGEVPYRKGPPKFLIKISGVDRLNACAHAIIKQIKKAAVHSVPIAVKAYCDCQDTAVWWAGIWYQFGIKPELLLTSTVYFEIQPRELQDILPKLPTAATRFVFKDRKALTQKK